MLVAVFVLNKCEAFGFSGQRMVTGQLSGSEGGEETGKTHFFQACSDFPILCNFTFHILKSARIPCIGFLL